MSNIITGIILIVIGLVTNTSMFLGQMSLFNIFFDVLGIILIIYGSVQLIKNKS